MLHPTEVRLDGGKSTAMLILNKDDVRASIEKALPKARELGLQEKSEVHITVLGFTTGRIIQDHLKALPIEERTYLQEELRELLQETDWHFSLEGEKILSIQKEYFDTRDGTKKETRQSIIQMVSVPGLATFYEHLNSLFGTQFPVPTAHISLFVGGTDPERSKMGIGIDSQEILQELHPKEL